MARNAQAAARLLVLKQTAIDLFVRGLTYRQIQAELAKTGDRRSVSVLHDWITAAIAERREHFGATSDEARALMLARCDRLILKLEASIGMTQANPQTIRAYLAVLERQAKLQGLDAPTKIDLTRPRPFADLPDGDIDEAIAATEQALATARGAVH